MSFQDFFENNHWHIVDVLGTEGRQAEILPVDDLPLAQPTRTFLQKAYPDGIYRHQKEALEKTLAGENICLVTGTASGKSLVFQAAAVDRLARNPKARVMAIYPMKALGNEQRERWMKTLVNAGMVPENAPDLENLVGRIDGNVPPGFRLGILERSRVVVFTPDIIHAWLFSNLGQPQVINFLRDVQLIVVDEVHSYSGVFGSNSAFLFRRLQHLLGLLGAHPQFICASATITRPAAHLRSLFGQDFALIGPEHDTSPRFPLQVVLAEPSGTERFLEEVVRLLDDLTHQSQSRFIAFVDSRKQVELITSILNRLQRDAAKAAAATAAAASEAEATALLEAEAAEAAGESAEESNGTARPASKGAGRKTQVRQSPGWGRSSKKKDEEESSPYDEPDLEGEVTGVLQQLNVLPYRAGYEDHDRRQIQERLANGTLNGVVSTSALELGIDIPHLDICVLIGVPGSATSLQQRIGRIGRHGPGTVVVINGGDVHDQAVFAHPKSFFQRPLAESTLYLENEHIQYIHALCLARNGGEHDQVLEAASKTEAKAAALYARRTKLLFNSPVDWPKNFIALCQKERAGETPRHLVSLRLEAHERPNYTFPLRDVESQFKVERRDGPNVSSMGSLSFAQLMREAYPGAIYYYATIPYRVTRVNLKAKVVTVRREKRYTTQPQKTLPAVFPQLSLEGIFSAVRQGGLTNMEINLLVRESIRGVTEQRGRSESLYPYPLPREMGYYQDQPYFSRNFFTTGIVVTHPALDAEGVNLELAAVIFYEAFMLMFPFDRQDIGFAADHLRIAREPFFPSGLPFLTIFDQTYGSLRLSARLLEPGMLGKVLTEATLLGAQQENLVRAPATLGALAEMAQAAFHDPREGLIFGNPDQQDSAKGRDARDPEQWERVVVPGSKGLMVRTNEEFEVIRILNTPAGISYEGTPSSMQGTGASVMPLIMDVAEIPGETEAGWYNIQTGALEPAGVEPTQVHLSGSSESPAEVDAGWLQHILAVYLTQDQLTHLAGLYGVNAATHEETAAALAGLPDRLAILDQVLAESFQRADEQRKRLQETPLETE